MLKKHNTFQLLGNTPKKSVFFLGVFLFLERATTRSVIVLN